MELKCWFLLCFIFTANMAWGHIPMRYFNSAEPDAPIYVPGPSTTKLSRQTALERLDAVRRVMAESGVDAYIIPTADAHNSQYLAPADARREWLSGLEGSSGTALVTVNRALLWTDARYFTQFYVQVDTTHWDLMRQGTDQTITEWLVSVGNLRSGAVVGVDPTTYTRSAWTPLENALSEANITLLATPNNLVDIARVNISDGPPSRPSFNLLPLTTNYTGRPASEKVAELVTQMQDRNATALILTALDDVAYTLNLRGTDIPFNPVFFAYLLIRTDVSAPNNIVLFWNDGHLASDVVQHLETENLQVQARPYSEILQNFTLELPYGSTVWLSEDASHAIYLAVENDGADRGLRILSTVSPVALMKVMKNAVELEGFRRAHVKDGVAVVRSLYWVHHQVNAGMEITEVQLSDRMRDFRAEEQDSMGPSFATIAGAGANGAIIHYRPSEDGEQTIIRRNDMLLIDSGGQYRDGTTDITRTRHMSASPTLAQRRAFTRVLKGQINLATAVFPSGTQGHVIEVLARKALWDVGLNYGHGTGHGVGHFLNVHEGPAWILSGPANNDPGIRANMIYSNEPGYYEVGEYGIRHEDLVETIEITRDADHQLADGMVADFEGRGAVGFYTISLAPHQTACLDVNLLTDFEIKYLNDYHSKVLSTIGPILQMRGYLDELAWLERECAPIGRSSAILFTLSPVLTVISIFRIIL